MTEWLRMTPEPWLYAAALQQCACAASITIDAILAAAAAALVVGGVDGARQAAAQQISTMRLDSN